MTKQSGVNAHIGRWTVTKDGPAANPIQSEVSPPPVSLSLLSEDGSDDLLTPVPSDRSYASDLNFDQIVTAIVGEDEEAELITALLYGSPGQPRVTKFRQEVFRDLDDPEVLKAIRAFVDQMLHVRRHLTQIRKMAYKYQRAGWLLDAVAIYCRTLRDLDSALKSYAIEAAALHSFRDFLSGYVETPSFRTLEAETNAQMASLSGITYTTRISGGRVDVTRYEGESDYSATIEETFDRFRQGDVKDYRIQYRSWPGMNHIGAQILDFVAKLFPDEFSALDEYCTRYADFYDTTVRRFEREIHFFLAYVSYIEPLRATGLPFCYPEIATESKDVFANESFDLALAQKLLKAKCRVVCNDFELRGSERVIVVSGPNQGGKTTFARMFGQIHQLARVGCPVPGASARLLMFDKLFTHFEKEEDLGNQRGKLEDDLVRIREVFQSATSSSILIMNEIFTSTTLKDSRFLGGKAMKKIVTLDLLCVYVTFVEELASFAPSVVSMVSVVVPDDPAERTFKVVRAPADGLAYAMAIAEKYGVTYSQLRHRLAS